MNSTPKYVVSRTLQSADWQNSTLIRGDVVEEISRLKQQPGRNIGMSGSATLVRSLLRENLLDELALLVPPVVVGGGSRLFEDWDRRLPLTLVDSKTLSNGVLVLTFEPGSEGGQER